MNERVEVCSYPGLWKLNQRGLLEERVHSREYRDGQMSERADGAILDNRQSKTERPSTLFSRHQTCSAGRKAS